MAFPVAADSGVELLKAHVSDLVRRSPKEPFSARKSTDLAGSRTEPWSFYIILCGGTADKLFFRDFDLEFFQEFGVVGHFLT